MTHSVIVAIALGAGAQPVAADEHLAVSRSWGAHSHVSEESYLKSRVGYLASEPLARMGLWAESLVPDERSRFAERLAKRPEVARALGMIGDSVPHVKDQILNSFPSWSQGYPSIAFDPNRLARTSRDTREALKQAFELDRVYFEETGIQPSHEGGESLEQLARGPGTASPSSRWSSLQEQILKACEGAELDENITTLPGVMGRLAHTWNCLPKSARKTAQDYAWLALGEGKTCRSLLNDVWQVVNPHTSSLVVRPKDQQGQIEGLSAWSASQLLEKGRAENLLIAGMRFEELDPAVSEWEAVQQALPEASDYERLLLLSALSHNHSIEIYLPRLVMNRANNPDQAAAMGMEALVAFDHWYELLARHRSARKAKAGSEETATSERPYHYWGGAMVSCELLNRGYSAWASKKVSEILGSVYESWTGLSGEGVPGKMEDIQLHRAGAKFGERICAQQPPTKKEVVK